MNAVVALYIYMLVPEFLMRFLAWLLDPHVLPRRRSEGLEQHPGRRARAILVCNHVSYVDAIVIAGVRARGRSAS